MSALGLGLSGLRWPSGIRISRPCRLDELVAALDEIARPAPGGTGLAEERRSRWRLFDALACLGLDGQEEGDRLVSLLEPLLPRKIWRARRAARGDGRGVVSCGSSASSDSSAAV